MRERIVAFLQDVGIPAPVADLPDPAACFLPGIRVQHGQVIHDPARLHWPGDLLHGPDLLAQFAFGARPGVHLLVTAGMTSRLPGEDGVAYPAMRAWVTA